MDTKHKVHGGAGRGCGARGGGGCGGDTTTPLDIEFVAASDSQLLSGAARSPHAAPGTTALSSIGLAPQHTTVTMKLVIYGYITK